MKKCSDLELKIIRKTLFFLCIIFMFAASCATLMPVETAYKAALRAEGKGDFESASTYYKKALDEARKSGSSNVQKWYIESTLFLDYRKHSSLQRVPITTDMIYDDLQRVRLAKSAGAASEHSDLIHEDLQRKISSQEFIVKGLVLTRNGNAIAGIKVFLSSDSLRLSGEDDSNLSAITDEKGNFNFSVKKNKNWVMEINNSDPKNILFGSRNIKFSNPTRESNEDRDYLKFLLDEGTSDQQLVWVEARGILKIELPYTKIGSDYYEVKGLMQKNAYREAIDKATLFLTNYKNVETPFIKEIKTIKVDAEKAFHEEQKNIMLADFNDISMADKNKNYEFIISQGRLYIDKYQNIEGSRWQEIAVLVNKAKKIKDDTRQAQLAKAEEERKRAEDEKKKRQIIAQQRKEKLDRLLPQCNNKILSHEDFLLGKNPYADQGKCVKITAVTFQMTFINTGLFRIGNTELAYIEFKDTFRGSYVEGIAKIKGVYNYTTKMGIQNQVPHFKMLKIEKRE